MADHLTMNQTDLFIPHDTMNSNESSTQVILTVIANWLTGDRVKAFAALHSATVCYSCQGTGTVRRARMREQGLSDMRKELVTILAEVDDARAILEDLKTELHLEEENAGIAFLREAVPHKTGIEREGKTMEKSAQVDFMAVHVLVNKGFAEEVILAGERAGTRGATVLPAKGEARPGDIPGLLIENDKELILIITSRDKARRLLEAIQTDDVLMGQGDAKVFMMEVIDTLGIKFY